MSDGASAETLNGTAQTQLRSIVERIERMEEDKAACAADLKEVYAEAKGNGFDTKTLRKVVATRKKDRAKYQEEQAIFDLYMSALGENYTLPLFPAATAAIGDDPAARDAWVEQMKGAVPEGGSLTLAVGKLKITLRRHLGFVSVESNG